MVTRQRGFLTLLRKKNFLRLWLAQLISMTILNASNYALLVLIEEVTGSTTLVGLAIICFSLPALLFGAPAGVFVDHMNKRRVLWTSNCLRAIATFGFVISLLANRHELISIYLLTFLISGIGQFFTPAEGSTIPMLVDEEELMPALSLFNVTFMLSQAVGFILFAPIILSVLPTFRVSTITINPVEMLYTIIALLYLVCAVLIALIPSEDFIQTTNNHRKAISDQSIGILRRTISIIDNIWTESLQGWRFIRLNKQLFLAVVQYSFAGVLVLVVGELATPLVTQLLNLPPNDMAFVFAPAGIGLVAGSVIMPRITQRLGKLRTIFIGSAAFAICIFLLPILTLLARVLQPENWNTNPLLLITVAFVMLLAGVALDFINIPAQTAIQELTPDWIKGRVLALQLTLYNACSIPVILFIGAVADIFGLARVIYLLSVIVIGFGIWGVYYERSHRNTAPFDKIEDEKELSELDRISG